jgi:hypothetical protein
MPALMATRPVARAYEESLTGGGDTGSTPARDANLMIHSQYLAQLKLCRFLSSGFFRQTSELTLDF